VSCFRERCRRKPTHDLGYVEVQARGEDGKRLWRDGGEPLIVPGVLRLTRGAHGCRRCCGEWAEALNARRR
jgi:hypothetical protein